MQDTLDYRKKKYDIKNLMVAVGILPDQREAYTILARTLNRSSRTVERLRRDGLSEKIADQFAVHLGLHPGQVWPEWWPDEASVAYTDKLLEEKFSGVRGQKLVSRRKIYKQKRQTKDRGIQ